MRLYHVKLNAWASPVWVQASNKLKAGELALAQYGKCDCCGAATKIESIKLAGVKSAPFYTTVILEVK